MRRVSPDVLPEEVGRLVTRLAVRLTRFFIRCCYILLISITQRQHFNFFSTAHRAHARTAYTVLHTRTQFRHRLCVYMIACLLRCPVGSVLMTPARRRSSGCQCAPARQSTRSCSLSTVSFPDAAYHWDSYHCTKQTHQLGRSRSLCIQLVALCRAPRNPLLREGVASYLARL